MFNFPVVIESNMEKGLLSSAAILADKPIDVILVNLVLTAPGGRGPPNWKMLRRN
jgi:hypothetical protein